MNKPSQQIQSILINLKRDDRASIPAFRPKHHYSELEIFRREVLENSNIHLFNPYSDGKYKTWGYKLIFATLSLFFFFIGLLIFTNNFYSVNELFYLPFNMIKNGVGFLSLLAGLSALFVTKKLKVEKEAAFNINRAAKNKLNYAYGRKRFTLGLHKLFYSNHERLQAFELKHNYYQAKERMDHYTNELERLFLQLSKSSKLSLKKRELLYNQALREYNDMMDRVVHAFRQLNNPYPTE